MTKKEEMLLYAIGELPEDMIIEEDMEEIIAGARQLKKEESKKKLIYLSRCMATVAACIAILFISVNILNKPNNNISDISISPSTIYPSADNNTSVSKKTASIFITDIKEETYEDSVSPSQKKATGKKDITGKKIPYNSTVNLQLEEQTYIVFSIDTSFHLTVSNKKSKTYITKQNGKKHYINGGEASYKAGSQVHLDINDSGKALDVVVPEWKKQGISVIAYADTGQEGDGIFYIGKADDSSGSNDNEREAYYGIFIKAD